MGFKTWLFDRFKSERLYDNIMVLRETVAHQTDTSETKKYCATKNRE